jgi:cytochrome c2
MNLEKISGLLLILSFAVLPINSANADMNNGKELHKGSCISCHASMMGGDGTGIYTREEKRIETYPALVKQVQRCRDSLGIPWPKEHVNDVVEYLNNSFYKYEK